MEAHEAATGRYLWGSRQVLDGEMIQLDQLTATERDWIKCAAAIAGMPHAEFITERFRSAIAADMAAAKNGRMTIPVRGDLQ